MKMFRWLQKHRAPSLLPVLFQEWPPTNANPFLLPVVLYSCYQLLPEDSPYVSTQYITAAHTQWCTNYGEISFLLGALMLTPSTTERLLVARRLIAAGVDPNARTRTAQLKVFEPFKGTDMARNELFNQVEEVTSLAFAATLPSPDLLHTLLNLGANPCFVCIYYSFL